MLALTRMKDQEIVITSPEGKEIIIQVLSVKGGKVKLGVKAEKSYRIDRGEVSNLRKLSQKESP
jgi:carbon storage regulator CsrA